MTPASASPPHPIHRSTAPILGIVTIGQSPRPDLARAFSIHAPASRVLVLGALDGVSSADIERMALTTSNYPLLVRLNNGDSCTIGMDALHPLVQARAQALAEEGARVVVVACAGAFPAIRCAIPVVLPGRVVPAVVGAITSTRRIGVVTPIAVQVPAATHKWQLDGFDPVVAWASPTVHGEIERASMIMRDAPVELVVLDCMGHDEAYATEFASRCGKRVATAQSLTARVAGEWMR